MISVFASLNVMLCRGVLNKVGRNALQKPKYFSSFKDFRYIGSWGELMLVKMA